MKISRVRDVKLPQRANLSDAGIDFFIPQFDEKFITVFKEKNKDIVICNDKIILNPHQRVLIPSGIHVNFYEESKLYKNLIGNSKYELALIANNKSGVASKKGVAFLASVVDLSYAGEVHISVVNTSGDIIELLPNEKIIQFILTPIICCDITEVKYEDLYKEFAHTSRNQGGFGSSGK